MSSKDSNGGPIDTLRFDDRVAIVTGAGGGLGLAYAELLAARGAAVVVNDVGGTLRGDVPDEGVAATAAASICAAGGVAVADTNSVASAEGASAIVQTALDAFGRVDIVINNAGILRDRVMQKTTADDFRAVLDVHLFGTYNVSHAAYGLMREQGFGRIVNTTSAAGLYGNFGQVSYAAAKMGIVGLTRALAVEGASRGVHVNVIAPGARSRMTEGLLAPAERLDPALVAPVVAWLSHQSCLLNGQILGAAGGRVFAVLIGETLGVFDSDLSLERVAASIEEIGAMDGFRVPADIASASAVLDEMRNAASTKF